MTATTMPEVRVGERTLTWLAGFQRHIAGVERVEARCEPSDELAATVCTGDEEHAA